MASIPVIPISPRGIYRYESNYILFPMAPTSVVTPYFGGKQVTLGVRFGEIAKASPFPAMGKEPVINDEVAGTKLVVVFYELHKLAIPYSRDVTVGGNSVSLTFDKIASNDDTYPFLLAGQGNWIHLESERDRYRRRPGWTEAQADSGPQCFLVRLDDLLA